MSQTKLCKDNTLLRLNVGKHGVDCLNTKDFKRLKSHMLHAGYGPLVSQDTNELYNPEVNEIIERFKDWYDTDNVELTYDNDYEFWRDTND